MENKKDFDIIIVGAGPVGIYLGYRFSKMDRSVLIIEKDSKESTGSKMDQFHLESMVFDKYEIPPPEEGTDEFITKFNYTSYFGPYGKYQQIMEYSITAMRFQFFIQRLLLMAEKEGVEFIFSAEYKKPIIKDKMLTGIKYDLNGSIHTVSANLIVDASGSSAIVRTSLPEEIGVENFRILDEEKMYVIQRVIEWKNPDKPHPGKGKKLESVSYLYYKTWIAPHFLPNANILGGGQPGGFENQEKAMETFLKDVSLPPYKIVDVHKATTAYRRSPFSIVGNGFLCIGDSACMSKSFSGEAIESSWNVTLIAVEEIDKLLNEGLLLTQENLWDINVRFFRNQGAKLAALLAQIPSAANLTKKDVSYLFKHNIIFSGEDFKSMWENLELNFGFGRLFKIIGLFLGGLITRKFTKKALSTMLKYMKISGAIRNHYEEYPTDISNYDEWVSKAKDLWEPVESMRYTLEDES
ncbi:MAG: hypothetical protein GF317_11545 [Candidatus Lokiarchaeota archaeon]|nr:hypothetical protein [Candidatus Lokiarchaeota archaeon]MBD3200285.1 hypothetical protein [Candidatus Lokiarchaeota archaeon]